MAKRYSYIDEYLFSEKSNLDMYFVSIIAKRPRERFVAAMVTPSLVYSTSVLPWGAR